MTSNIKPEIIPLKKNQNKNEAEKRKKEIENRK